MLENTKTNIRFEDSVGPGDNWWNFTRAGFWTVWKGEGVVIWMTDTFSLPLAPVAVDTWKQPGQKADWQNSRKSYTNQAKRTCWVGTRGAWLLTILVPRWAWARTCWETSISWPLSLRISIMPAKRKTINTLILNRTDECQPSRTSTHKMAKLSLPHSITLPTQTAEQLQPCSRPEPKGFSGFCPRKQHRFWILAKIESSYLKNHWECF